VPGIEWFIGKFSAMMGFHFGAAFIGLCCGLCSGASWFGDEISHVTFLSKIMIWWLTTDFAI
jgi:hypothetical protein